MDGCNGAKFQNPMGTSLALKDAVNHFRSIDWTREIIDSQQYRITTPSFRTGKLGPHEDTFFGQTLNSSLTLSHWLYLVHKTLPLHPEYALLTKLRLPPQTSSHATPGIGCIFLLQLGTGLWGFKDTMHGGAICAVLDQCLTLCADLHRAAIKGTAGTLYTGSIQIAFRAPMLAPSTILVECWLEARKGRKWFVRGCIKGEKGSVLAEANGCWILSSQML